MIFNYLLPNQLKTNVNNVYALPTQCKTCKDIDMLKLSLSF